MLAYLVLSSRTGAPVDPGMIHRFDRDELPDIPLRPTEHVLWQNASRTTAFFGWQAFTGFAGIGSHWEIDRSGLTAFSGHCWPRETGWKHGSGRSWAAQLREWLAYRADLREARDELFGQFTLIALTAMGDGFIAPDFMNAEPMFVAESDELTAFSNRAGLAARAVAPAGIEPERSLMGAGWLLCLGSMLDEESGYWDAQHLPFGSHVTIHSTDGARVAHPGRSPLVPAAETSYEDALDRVDRELRNTMRVIAQLPIPDLELALSGGKDSRLLTAVILSEGLRDRFRFSTNGPPDKADPLAARRIAATFGLNWSLIDHTGRSPEATFEEVRAHTSLVEGITSAWDAVGPTGFAAGATVSGLAGEYLRWGALGLKGTRVASKDELLGLLRRSVGFDPLGILRPEALEYYHQAMASWANQHLERGDDVTQIGSFYMQETRLRSRAGPTQAWNARMRLSPFSTRGVVQANHGLPAASRPSQRFTIDLMRRHSLALSKLPLAASTWDEGDIAHLPDADDYRRMEPVRTTSIDVRNWRLMHYADYLPMLRTYLLDRQNPIHELVRFDRLEERIATGDANPGRTRMLWGALTAAIWMGRHELDAKITP